MYPFYRSPLNVPFELELARAALLVAPGLPLVGGAVHYHLLLLLLQLLLLLLWGPGAKYTSPVPAHTRDKEEVGRGGRLGM